MPFEWTVNPYRGCTHACVYCFARKTHSYLDLDTGLGFDSQIVVKVNAPEVLRRQLASRRWQGEHVAMGTNVDCYQRAEGRYRLMPGIIEALTERANPFSILTKGTLILRDLDLLTRAARVTEVGISVSVGFTDAELWRTVEPGTPAPERRLEVVRALGERGIGCGVLMAPVIPFLGDEPAQLRATVRAIAAAGATSVTPLVLHLRPGAREWFMAWLGRHHPHLVRRYERLYADGATPRSGTSAGSRVRCTTWPASTASVPRARACREGSRSRSTRARPNPRPRSRCSFPSSDSSDSLGVRAPVDEADPAPKRKGSSMTYGCIASMKTRPGFREEVVSLLLSAADGLRDAGCELYVVGLSEDDETTIWVTEVWRTREDHDASLELPAAKDAIGRAMPMLTGEFTKQEMSVAGGLGL